ncbi:hypothetical protein B0H10DRAFT_2439843 [Mycena sp. CBHHK59/15]|nr:hypothetical protein B0H10DRAFT_2439843 [Mycena sp. CBHHK59/15]
MAVRHRQKEHRQLRSKYINFFTPMQPAPNVLARMPSVSSAPAPSIFYPGASFHRLRRSSFASVDFEQCFLAIRNGSHGHIGGTDNQGNPVPDTVNATSITYDLCIKACGSGGGAFSWFTFGQQFSSWLLPWLALLSQFPFGSRNKWDNFMSVILTLGSPCLAVYSLTLTVLNNKWVARRLAGSQYPNSRRAALILSSLQQAPLKVTADGSLLASLVVLPENDEWWTVLAEWLDYADIHTWTIAGITSVAWVVIAYALTIIGAFGCRLHLVLDVAFGYLQISPRCASERLTTALNRANSISYVAGPNGVVKAEEVDARRALSFHLDRDGALYHDQEATAPIYNYSRFFSFTQVAEEFALAFRLAAEKSHRHKPVDPAVQWHIANRITSAPPYVRRSHWGPDVFSRFFIASLAALTLQWATSGASIVIVFFTPTVGKYLQYGLGCRSGAYLVYAAVATLVWIFLVASSIVGHYATAYSVLPDFSHRAAAQTAVFLRRLAKFLATCNATWIIAAFLLQFGNFYDRCYCNSDVLGLGKRAHNVMVLENSDITAMKAAWIGGVVLAVAVPSLFLGFINVFIDTPPK